MTVTHGVLGLANELGDAEPQISAIILELVGSFAASGFQVKIHSNERGKSHVGFWRNDAYLFALIINKAHVLFYLRGSASTVEIPPEWVAGGVKGERTIRLQTIDQAQHLTDQIGLLRPFIL